MNPDDENLIKAFKECSKKYGKKFTVKQYMKYARDREKAPFVHEVYKKSTFNKVKKKLFGKESLNRKLISIDKIKKNYKKVCDDNGEKPLNLSEYGRLKEKGMITAQVMRKKTTSKLLKKWYKQKKRDELLNTDIAKKYRIKRKDDFKQFCKNCVRENCNLTRETCPYWNEDGESDD